MKLYIDDIREAPPGWILARTISEAFNILLRYKMEITHVSLDHDISIPVKVGDVVRPYPSPDTFKVVAQLMCEMEIEESNVFDTCIITTHSSNPDGRRAIVQIFDDAGLTCTETPAELATRRAI